MFCQDCGNKLPDGAKFCGKCGAKQALIMEVVNESNKNIKKDISVINIKRPKVFVMIAAVIIALIICIAVFSGLSGSNNVEDYYDSWVAENVVVEDDRFEVCIFQHADGDIVTFEVYYAEYSPMFRTASFIKEIPLDEIRGNKISFDYEDDYWGNSGTCIITFDNEEVKCEIKNVKNPDGMFWGILEGKYNLHRYDFSQEDTYYEEEDYYEPEPTYDMSKASGILASLGLTEEEFKNICIPLEPSKHKYDNELRKDMYDYPNNYVGQAFSALTFRIDKKEVDVNGRFCYTDYTGGNAEIILIDYRDDMYSPNLSESDFIKFYGIFDGIYMDNMGDEYLVFHMLCCEYTND